jgi:hypothetical protein
MALTLCPLPIGIAGLDDTIHKADTHQTIKRIWEVKRKRVCLYSRTPRRDRFGRV